MTTVDIHIAKDLLHELIKYATSGEEVIIAESGKPMAKLIAVVPALVSSSTKRRPGALKGRIWIADDFDAPQTTYTRLLKENDERPARHPRFAMVVAG